MSNSEWECRFTSKLSYKNAFKYCSPILTNDELYDVDSMNNIHIMNIKNKQWEVVKV